MSLRAMSGAAVAALVMAATAARADVVAPGVVVKVDAGEIYVNLGSNKGVADGAALRLKRPIVLRHPVTRAPVRDWLPLGSATITSAGGTLAMAVLDDVLHAQVRVGDLVEVYVEREESRPAPAAPAPAPPPDAQGPLPAIDADTASVLQVWAAQSGQSLDRRVAAWEGWLATHADSALAAGVRDDLEVLRAQREAATPRRPTAGGATAALGHIAPTRAQIGDDIPLVFVMEDPGRVVTASLHYRVAGARTYRRLLLGREHDLYLRGTIPAAVVAAPGVEYFVEATLATGASGAAAGTPDQPLKVTVAPPPLIDRFVGTRNRTRMSIMASYLDFGNLDDRPGDRTDRFYLGEVDVLFRIGDVLWGVRAGYGSYGGRGGLANQVWTEPAPAPEVGFQYGYAEAEVRAPSAKGPPLGAAARLYAGVGNEGFGLGIAGRVRIGDADLTNLSASVSTIDQVGFFSDLRLEAWPDRRLPVGISVGVTDQPGTGDLGVRLAADLGWRARSWIQPTVRLSWQGRTAVHSGLGGGLGLVFDW